MQKIFCFINQSNHLGYIVVALCEDGTLLASHFSSSISFAKSDIGIDTDKKHDAYKLHCKNGYELEWIDEPLKSWELRMALIKNENKEEHHAAF